VLTETERDCLNRYCRLLAERLGRNLVAIRMFGSAARGDMWPAPFLEQVRRDGVDVWSSR
jgi:predicted nucleotidyltransferase